MRILLAENDIVLGEGICNSFKQHHYTIDWVKDGKSAQHALLSEYFDTAILNLKLPRRSGLEILKTIRAHNVTVPIIMLTTMDSVADRIKILDLGADDYMSKEPLLNLDELTARVRALHRRTTKRAQSAIDYGALTLEPDTRSVFIEKKLIKTSRREFTLLKKLLENMDRVISREALMQTLYGWSDTVDSNTLEVHIHNLRKKFGKHLPIKTIRGVGYVLRKTQ